MSQTDTQGIANAFKTVISWGCTCRFSANLSASLCPPKPSAGGGGGGVLPPPCLHWGWLGDRQSNSSEILASSLAAGTRPSLFAGVLEDPSVSQAAALVYLCSGNLQNHSELHPARAANSPHL